MHVTIPWHLVGNDMAVIISVPGDKRSLFIVPWGELPDGTFEHCYVGTTDTDFDGALDDPQTDDADLDYVLAPSTTRSTTTITRDDVTGVWAGLRPLVKARRRRPALPTCRGATASVPATAGLVTVTGGKLTTYREMASDTVDVVIASLGVRARCRTKRMALLGAEGFHAGCPPTPTPISPIATARRPARSRR